eukprot:8162482-Lingulodinium_polyedra.AAC.1
MAGPSGLWTMASRQSSKCCCGTTCVLMEQVQGRRTMRPPLAQRSRATPCPMAWTTWGGSPAQGHSSPVQTRSTGN